MSETIPEQLHPDSIYTQHFTQADDVAKKWSHVLVAHLGIREANGCAAFDTLLAQQETAGGGSKKQKQPPQPQQYQSCALPSGWTVDYSPDVTEAEDNEGGEADKKSLQQQQKKSVAAGSETMMVLKAQPPKTRPYENHPEKGDCLIARDTIPAGTTVVAEASLLHAPQDPSHFFVAAAAARAVESRSKSHYVVSRAAGAAAAFIRMCYQATGEDERAAASAAAAAAFSVSSSSGRTPGANSTFSLFRIMCPQWVAALIFATILRVGNTTSSSSSTTSQRSSSSSSIHNTPALDILAPGWEVVGTFSASSCGGVPEPEPAKKVSDEAAATASTEYFRKIQQEETVEEQRAREVNEYRSGRWAEWMCAAKLMHRVAMKHLPAAMMMTSNSNKGDDAKRLLFECLSNGKTLSSLSSSSSSSSATSLSDEALCALALDINGFLSTDSITGFLSAKAQNARFLVGKSILRAVDVANNNNNNSNEKQQQQQQQTMTMMTKTHSKPVFRLAYFLDALSSNAVEVSVPGIPKRLAVFSYMRLAEHECRPSCSVSFLDSPPLHGSAAYVAATQLQWDDPIHGCLITGGVRHAHLLKKEKVIDEVRHERSAAGHPMAAYGGGCAANLLLIPSVVCLATVREVGPGEPVSIAYTGSALMTWHERNKDLVSRYGFHCRCIWCVGFAPDLARAFRCPHCPKGQGVVCPRSDGSQLSLWECIQCGFRPDAEFVAKCCDSEHALSKIKAESTAGLAKLVEDEHLHYSHALVCRKLDGWAEKAWRQQEAEVCISVVEVLLRCIDRLGTDDIDGFAAVLKKSAQMNEQQQQQHEDGGYASAAAAAAKPASDLAILPFVTEDRAQRRGPSRWTKNPPRDTMLAQYLELLGKANHAVGNAHTSRYYYTTALAIRERCGQALSWWCRATRFMAISKSLADLMDAK